MTTTVANSNHPDKAPLIFFAVSTRGTGRKELGIIVSARTAAEARRQVLIGDAEVAAESAPRPTAAAIVDVRVEPRPWGATSTLPAQTPAISSASLPPRA